MADYAATVTSELRKPITIGNSMVLYYGTVNVTNYNTTLAEITDITKMFRNDAPVVALGGITDNGFLVAWVAASKAIKAWYPLPAHTHVLGLTKGAVAANTEIGLSSDATGATLNNNTIAATLALTEPIANSTAAAGSQVASNVDVGAVSFFAFGLQ